MVLAKPRGEVLWPVCIAQQVSHRTAHPPSTLCTPGRSAPRLDGVVDVESCGTPRWSSTSPPTSQNSWVFTTWPKYKDRFDQDVLVPLPCGCRLETNCLISSLSLQKSDSEQEDIKPRLSDIFTTGDNMKLGVWASGLYIWQILKSLLSYTWTYWWLDILSPSLSSRMCWTLCEGLEPCQVLYQSNHQIRILRLKNSVSSQGPMSDFWWGRRKGGRSQFVK